MKNLQTFLEKLFQGNCHVVVQDHDEKIILYDIALWNKATEHKILQKFPHCSFETQADIHSLSGFSVIIYNNKNQTHCRYFILFILLLCLFFLLYSLSSWTVFK